MRCTQLGAATALVAATQAFLLPPTITSADIDIIKTLPFEDAINIKDRIVEIDCPGCPVVVADIEGKIHSAQVENVLRLNFSLSLGDNDDLLMNDARIYPIDRPLMMEPIKADQLVKSPAGTWEYVASPRLGFAVAISHSASSADEQLNLVDLKIEILKVADQFVNPINAVVVKLLETPSRKLMIGHVDIIPIPVNNPSSNPNDKGQECTTMLCKWRAVIADKLSKAKGAVKGCAGKARPGAHGKHGSELKAHGHGRPRPHGPHRPHRHHHRHGGFVRFLRSIVLHIFIPIMIGVVVGVTTSLIGMVIGHLIIFIWRVLFRRGQRGQYRRVQSEEAAKDDDDETKSFLSTQEPPPTYEEIPAFKEAVVDEKVTE